MIQFHLPTQIRIAPGAWRELDALLPEGDCFLLCGSHCRKTAEEFAASQQGKRNVFLCSDIPAELPLPDAERVLDQLRRLSCSIVIALGGGSVMDAGKTLAALAPLPGSVEEYFYGKRKITGKGLFFAAVPTTAGTGAEMTANAVLWDPSTGIKQSLRHPSMMADLALVDAELTWHTPAGVTAASGLDALTQALESSISRKATQWTRLWSVRAAKQIMENLKNAAADDPCARAAMAEASALTGMAFAQSGLGAVHGIAHPLGSRLHVPHGVACGVLLVPVLQYNRDFLEKIAADLGYANADEVIVAVSDLRKAVGVPENFRFCGLQESDFDFIVRNCRSGSMLCNPAEFSDDDARELLRGLC